MLADSPEELICLAATDSTLAATDSTAPIGVVPIELKLLMHMPKRYRNITQINPQGGIVT